MGIQHSRALDGDPLNFMRMNGNDEDVRIDMGFDADDFSQKPSLKKFKNKNTGGI